VKKLTPYILFIVFFIANDIAWAATSPATEQLFTAIQKHNTEQVGLALKAGADPNALNSQAPLAFETPLALAVTLGDIPIVNLLVKQGADINKNVGFWHNISPFYLAVRQGDLAMVKHLHDLGAKIAPNRWTPLKEILRAPYDLLRGKVVDLQRPPSLIEAAETSGNTELVLYLKKQGAR